MEAWEPAALAWVADRLQREMELLHPSHRARLARLLVTPYSVLVESHPGESVVVVGEHEESVLYWSDVEDGWELDSLTSGGGITERGCSQLDLGQVAHALFGPSASGTA